MIPSYVKSCVARPCYNARCDLPRVFCVLLRRARRGAAWEARLKQSDIAERLILVEESLARIELALATRVPVADIRQSMDDAFATYGLVAQLRELHTNQRDQLTILVGLAAQLIADAKKDDAELRDLLVQLRELGRKHVRGLADLERAQDWHETQAEQRIAGGSEGVASP